MLHTPTFAAEGTRRAVVEAAGAGAAATARGTDFLDDAAIGVAAAAAAGNTSSFSDEATAQPTANAAGAAAARRFHRNLLRARCGIVSQRQGRGSHHPPQHPPCPAACIPPPSIFAAFPPPSIFAAVRWAGIWGRGQRARHFAAISCFRIAQAVRTHTSTLPFPCHEPAAKRCPVASQSFVFVTLTHSQQQPILWGSLCSCIHVGGRGQECAASDNAFRWGRGSQN